MNKDIIINHIAPLNKTDRWVSMPCSPGGFLFLGAFLIYNSYEIY